MRPIAQRGNLKNNHNLDKSSVCSAKNKKVVFFGSVPAGASSAAYPPT